jgi:hypothetical protein
MRVSEPQTVSVSGSARRHVNSDLAIWKGTCLVEAENLVAAQRQLKEHIDRVQVFLGDRVPSDYNISPIQIEEVRVSEWENGRVIRTTTAGYRLRQSVEVTSTNVDRIVEIDRECALLVEEGIHFKPDPIRFIYTRAGDAKVEMLAEATEDARRRAEQIAVQGGAAVARLRSARMGVFQITAVHSAETSWQGVYDTASREKTITAVVSANFALR